MIKRIYTSNNIQDRKLDSILIDLVDIQDEIKDLPSLPSVEKAKLEHSIAIDQLYYSSKIEGSNLTEKMIDGAIND